MLKKSTAILVITVLVLFLCACGSSPQPAQTEAASDTSTPATSTETQLAADQSTKEEESTTPAETSNAEDTETLPSEKTGMIITITAGAHTITATLYDNAAGRALWDMLPLTLPMMNLYGREMCYRFGAGGLPDDDTADTGYEIGDISYWPPAGSLVILYKQNGEVFEQQPIGHTDDDVSFFDGMSDTDISFERAN